MCQTCEDQSTLEDARDDRYANFTDYYEHLRDENDEVNAERLLEELRFITIYPEKWDQSLWFAAPIASIDIDNEKPTVEPKSACGSFGCLAGNTVARADLDLVWYKEERWEDDQYLGYRWACSSVYTESEEEWNKRRASLTSYEARYASRRTEYISYKAAELLGLNTDQADAIFGAENTLRDLWEFAYVITNGKITPEDFADAQAAAKIQEEKEEKEKQNA